MLTNVLLALVLSAAIALATGPKLIEWLRGHQMKTSENELGPKEHLKKRGTPIMGGLMIALGCIVSFVLWARLEKLTSDLEQQTKISIAQRAEIQGCRETSENLNQGVSAVRLLLQEHGNDLSRNNEAFEERVAENE